jgi:hypothetical protein
LRILTLKRLGVAEIEVLTYRFDRLGVRRLRLIYIFERLGERRSRLRRRLERLGGYGDRG